MVIDCIDASWFEVIWYCWDVPNWLTLSAEIAVAAILGYIFLRKGEEFNRELKKVRDSQKTWADFSIMFAIEKALHLVNDLEKDYEKVSTNQTYEIEKTIWEKRQAIIKKSTSRLDNVLNQFGTILLGDTIMELRGISRNLKSLTPKPNLENTERIFSIRRDIVHTSKKLSIGIMPDLKKLIDEAEKKNSIQPRVTE